MAALPNREIRAGVKRLKPVILAIYALAFFFLFALLPVTVKADPVFVDLSGTIQDTYISEETPTLNYNGGPITEIAQRTGPSGTFRALIRWNADDIPFGATILDANLSLLLTENTNETFGQLINIFNITGAWTVNGVTWNNQPTAEDTGLASDTPAATARQEFQVITAIHPSSNNLGVELRYFDEDAPTDAEHSVYSSRENATAGDRPTLWVLYEFTSEPPEMDTFAASQIAMTSARLNGNLTSLGTALELEVFFEYGLTPSFGQETTHFFVSEIGPVFRDISGLTPDTEYFFQLHAIDVDFPANEGNGDTVDFTTLAGPSDLFTSVVNFAWLLAFVATLTLMLMGAWWVKSRRGG